MLRKNMSTLPPRMEQPAETSEAPGAFTPPLGNISLWLSSSLTVMLISELGEAGANLILTAVYKLCSGKSTRIYGEWDYASVSRGFGGHPAGTPANRLLAETLVSSSLCDHRPTTRRGSLWTGEVTRPAARFSILRSEGGSMTHPPGSHNSKYQAPLK
jgi:hypothetical protein